MALADRSTIAVEDSWDLSPMYADSASWQAELATVENLLPKLQSYDGRLSESAETLAEALQCYLDIGRMVERVYVYAHLRSDEDTTDAENLGAYQLAAKLYTEFSAASSFINPELLRLDEEILQTFLKSTTLAPFKRMLERVVRYRPHTLSREEESLLASGSEVFSASSTIFSQLNNADFEFGEIEVDGKLLPLSHSTYITFLRLTDRTLRERAYSQYYSVFDSHKYTLAASLTASVKKDVYLAKSRNFPSAITSSLFADNISVDVYDTLIDCVNASLPSLHRYYELRKRLSGLDALRLYDTYIPLVDSVHVEHSYDEAVAVICDSLEPLGEEYVKVLRDGLLQGRWVDRFENKGKRSGAYSSGCFDSPPYILMNYKSDELRDVYTLTHEAGHSMHSYYSAKHQAFQDYHYTIFVAEVASTFNEQLLTHHLRQKHADNPRLSAYLVNHQLDDIKSTLFRQTMFADFERFIHQTEENGSPLTIDTFRTYYRTLLESYFGPAVTIEDIDSLECFRIPHFYSAFYVYKYATGLSAAANLAQEVLAGNTSARDRYLNFLKAGGSKYPLELLQDAGVDMTSPAPVKKTIALFDSLVDELERLLDGLSN